jgi:hypothetical protein
MDKQINDLKDLSFDDFDVENNYLLVQQTNQTKKLKLKDAISIQDSASQVTLSSAGNDDNLIATLGNTSSNQITTYDLSSFGVPESARAANISLYFHSSAHPRLYFYYYNNAQATEGHYFEMFFSRARIHTFNLWLPVDQQSIYIKWQSVNVAGGKAELFYLGFL